MAAATRFGTSVTTTTPELMVYAGSKEEHAEPRVVLVFEAKTGGGWDSDNYKKAELLVDAETGEILHERNLILHADGNIGGQATTRSGADVCDPEALVADVGLILALIVVLGNSSAPITVCA